MAGTLFRHSPSYIAFYMGYPATQTIFSVTFRRILLLLLYPCSVLSFFLLILLSCLVIMTLLESGWQDVSATAPLLSLFYFLSSSINLSICSAVAFSLFSFATSLIDVCNTITVFESAFVIFLISILCDLFPALPLLQLYPTIQCTCSTQNPAFLRGLRKIILMFINALWARCLYDLLIVSHFYILYATILSVLLFVRI